MIWYWLRSVVRYFLFLVKVPTARDVARVDPNLSCPVCGHQKGRLRCVRRSVRLGESAQPALAVLCQHTCLVCGARFYEAPVTRVTELQIQGAISRDDLERAEDQDYNVQAQMNAQAFNKTGRVSISR